jgi:hypothetical protein
VRAPAVLLLAFAGCGASTGVDVEVLRADELLGDQVRIEGTVGTSRHESVLPESARTLGAVEDARIVVPDSQAGQTITVTGTVLKGGVAVGAPQSGMVQLEGHQVPRIILCFDPAGCTPLP